MKLVGKLKGIFKMPEFEDSTHAAMWHYRFNPLMLLISALCR